MKKKVLILGMAMTMVFAQGIWTVAAPSPGTITVPDSGSDDTDYVTPDQTPSQDTTTQTPSQDTTTQTPAQNTTTQTPAGPGAGLTGSTSQQTTTQAATQTPQTPEAVVSQVTEVAAAAPEQVYEAVVSTGTVATSNANVISAVIAAATNGVTVAPQPTAVVNQAVVSQLTSGIQGTQASISTQVTGYTNTATVAAIEAVNANQATLTSLPTVAGTDLSKTSLLSGFQQLSIVDPTTGAKVTPAAGTCVPVQVAALTPDMQVFLVYVDPATGLAVKVPATGVDFTTQIVLVDASITGSFSIAYERAAN